VRHTVTNTHTHTHTHTERERETFKLFVPTSTFLRIMHNIYLMKK